MYHPYRVLLTSQRKSPCVIDYRFGEAVDDVLNLKDGYCTYQATQACNLKRFSKTKGGADGIGVPMPEPLCNHQPLS